MRAMRGQEVVQDQVRSKISRKGNLLLCHRRLPVSEPVFFGRGVTSSNSQPVTEFKHVN